MALGAALILNLSNVINFAHGNFLALGGYFAYVLGRYIGFWPALLVAPFAVALIGFIMERTMIRRVYNRDPVYSLLLTFGLAFIIQDVCRYIWGSNGLPLSVPDVLVAAAERRVVLHHRLSRVHHRCRHRRGRRAVRVPALHRAMGMRIRAGTLDLETVAALGDQRALAALVQLRARHLPGRAGRRAGRRARSGSIPNMGDDLLMPSFIAIIVGGVGSLTGTLIGGVLIGVAAAVTTVFYPAGSEVVIYVIMALVLLMRPRGLMGEEGMLA